MPLKLSALAFLCCVAAASAADLTIHLPDDPPVTRKTVEYECDAHGTDLGLPSGKFTVEYITAGPNNLAIVPLFGHTLIFSSVLSASGVRYSSQHYTWWDAKGAATLSSTAPAGEVQSSCHRTDSN